MTRSVAAALVALLLAGCAMPDARRTGAPEYANPVMGRDFPDPAVLRAETDYEAAKQDLLVRAANRYFGVLAAEDNLASAIAAREAVSRQLEQAQRRFEVGLIAITDVQQSQAGYDDAVAVVIDSQRQLATAHEFLREIIGELVTDLAGPIDDLPLLSPDPADVRGDVLGPARPP